MAKPQEPTRTQVANKVVEVAHAVSEVVPTRRIDDIPTDFARADGAREIAVLTLTAMSHEFEFKPVMAALEKLASLQDWSHSFFVAHKTWDNRPAFNWREAPLQKYESFKDFYQREIEQTFGNWESLQHTWSEVIKGKITEAEGRKIILGKSAGRPKTENRGDNFDVTTILKTNERNSRAHILARLDQEHPDLAAKVRANEVSANAVAVELGWRKKRERPKLTAKDRIRKLIVKHLTELSAEDRAELVALLTHETAAPTS